MVRAARQMTGARRFGTKDVLDRMDPDVNFWAFAKVTQIAAAAKARAMAEFGMADAAGNRTGPGLREILAPIADGRTATGARMTKGTRRFLKTIGMRKDAY